MLYRSKFYPVVLLIFFSLIGLTPFSGLAKKKSMEPLPLNPSAALVPKGDKHSLDQHQNVKLAPDVIGFRAIYGQSNLSRTQGHPTPSVSPLNETLYGSAISLEWALFHHHLEFEFIVGGFEHQQLFDEFAEAVFKLPYHIGQSTDVLIGLGGVVETYKQHPEVGITADFSARYWLGHSWGLSGEIDYLKFKTGAESTEWIAEVLYRF